MDGNGVRVIKPPLLNNKITVSSTENTNRWVFYGTRPEILDWIKNHSELQLENSIFASGGGAPSTFSTHTELVIDLLYFQDPDQSLVNYFKSFIQTDFQNEKVKVEIRPRVESKDQMISTLCRVIIKSGVLLGDIYNELNQEWYQPTRTYIEQASDLLNDNPGPIHIISTDTPMDIQIDHSN